MNAAERHMSEEQAVHLVRNALLVAGHEMGEQGDHWPVIKSTIHDVMKDYENLKIERNVSAELKAYYGNIIRNIEKNLHLCPPDKRAEATRIAKEMREIYEAGFEEPSDQTMYVVCDAEVPIHIQRVEKIMRTLEDEDE